MEQTKQSTKKIERLATVIQNEILGLGERMDGLEQNIKAVKSDTEDIKAEVNKKVDRIIHNELKYRVEKVEEKLNLKPKLKFA